MPAYRGWSRQVLKLATIVLLPMGIPFIIVGGAAWLLFGIGACITETKAAVTLSQLRFQIEETDCSTLGEDATVSIYGSSEGESNRTLLFKYGPGLDDLPGVEVLGNHTIRISVQDIAEVDFQRHEWMNWLIAYQIGHIHYPRSAN